MPPPSRLRRGDVVLVPFPFADLTAQKVRPAVIVSADPQAGDVIAAFIISVITNQSPRGAEVQLFQTDPEFGASALRVDSLVRLDKLVTLSDRVVARRLGVTGPVTRRQTDLQLRRALDLP